MGLLVVNLSALPWKQERRVDEGLVVQVKNVADARLGLPDRVASDRPEAVAGGDLELQNRGASAAAGPRIPAVDPVPLVARHKLQDNSHVLAPLMDKLFLGAGPRLPPQGPRDAVKKGRLAVPVVPAETRHVDALEIERRGLVAIAHEVLHGEFQRDQYAGLLGRAGLHLPGLVRLY